MRLAAALVLALVLPGAAARVPPASAGAPHRSSAAATASTARPLLGTWSRLPPAQLAPDEGLASAWTGRQLLVVSRRTIRATGGTVSKRVMIAAAYDPRAGTWHRLPPLGPTGSFMRYSAVWTGTEALVWGQGVRDAYNPVTKRWRRLPGSHLLAVHDGFGLVAWTGRQLIGWGGGCCGDAFSDGVAYTPATSAWRSLPPSPLAGSQSPLGAWTGRELVVLVGGLDPDGKPWPARLARAAAYDPVTSTWRRIAPLPEPRGGANVVWDGREILVVGGAGAARAGRPAEPAAVGFAYNPATNRWRRLPPMEQGRTGGAAVWTGSRLLVWGGQTNPSGSEKTAVPAHGLAYDPRTNTWSPLPGAPLLGRLDPTAVWTGKAMLVWGGHTTGCRHGARQCKTTVFADGAAFTPATP